MEDKGQKYLSPQTLAEMELGRKSAAAVAEAIGRVEASRAADEAAKNAATSGDDKDKAVEDAVRNYSANQEVEATPGVSKTKK